MDRTRFSRIAHGELEVWNPVPLAALLELARPLGLAPGQTVLDVGCGRALFLAHLIARHGVAGVGVDPVCAVVPRPSANGLELVAEEFRAEGFAPASCALVVCLGATHAVGGFAAAFDVLGPLVRPGGHLLLGEGYWREPPAPEYLELLGGTVSDLGTHADNQRAGVERGWHLAAARETQVSEWDHYEGTYARNVRAYLDAHPDDPDAAAMRARIERWNGGYERYGRRTLGFGVYLFARPLETAQAGARA